MQTHCRDEAGEGAFIDHMKSRLDAANNTRIHIDDRRRDPESLSLQPNLPIRDHPSRNRFFRELFRQLFLVLRCGRPGSYGAALRRRPSQRNRRQLSKSRNTLHYRAARRLFRDTYFELSG